MASSRTLLFVLFPFLAPVNRAPHMHRRTNRAHGRTNPDKPSPCHIEVVFVEKEETFAKSGARQESEPEEAQKADEGMGRNEGGI